MISDFKNILLAWTSSVPTVFAAAETTGLISLLSAIILPVVFFTVGKTIDVLLQLHFRRRDRQSDSPTSKESGPEAR